MTIYVFMNMNPSFEELSAVFKAELTLSIRLFKIQRRPRKSDFKSE